MARARSKVILVFGESNNDRSAIIEIAKALRPDIEVKFDKRSKPLVLLRSTERRSTRRSVADEIAGLVKAAAVTNDVIAVIAHRDCDAIEPAHEKVAREIEQNLRSAGVEVPIAAAPAYEMEAWWFLFPDAVAAVQSCWRRIPSGKSAVGHIQDAKEVLRRSLRPTNAAARAKCLDYTESDSIAIAKKIRELSLMDDEVFKRSGSLRLFRESLSRI